jgi:hypothetical protein
MLWITPKMLRFVRNRQRIVLKGLLFVRKRLLLLNLLPSNLLLSKNLPPSNLLPSKL